MSVKSGDFPFVVISGSLRKASTAFGTGFVTSEPAASVVDDRNGPAWISPCIVAFLPSPLVKRLVGCRAFRFYSGDSLQYGKRRKQPDT
jgi:hypothetical protein